MAKDPSFPFYASDWLGSTRIALMNAEHERGYLRLLCHMWNAPGCALADDDQVLARLSLIGEQWLKGGAELVRNCFIAHPTMPGYITHEKLLALKLEREVWRQKSQEGGRKSAEARQLAKGGSTTVSTKAATNGQPKGNSSSSSPSSSPLSSSSPSSDKTLAAGAALSGKPDCSNDIRAVFDHYRGYHAKAHPKPTSRSKTWVLIAARLREGYTADDLCRAIDGNHKSAFHNGQNENGMEYHSLELIVRDSGKVAGFIELAAAGPSRVLSEKSRRSVAALDTFYREEP